MHFDGLIIGACSLFFIGILHPVVIKVEYYFGTKAWPIFLILGIGLIALGLFIERLTLSIILSVLGFSLLWSIHELFAQKKRVEKGWFPKREK